MVKVGDCVLYTRAGSTVNALVLGIRSGQISHEGANSEPLVTLAFIKFPAPNAPHKRQALLQSSVATPEVEIEHDVVHASHEFSEDYKRERGLLTEAQIAAERGHGEWQEAE